MTCPSFVGLDLFTSIVDVVTGILKSLLCRSSPLFLLPQSFLQFAHHVSISVVPFEIGLVRSLQFLYRIEHILALLMIVYDDVVLLLQSLVQRKDLIDMIQTALFLLFPRSSLAAGVSEGSFAIEVDARLER